MPIDVTCNCGKSYHLADQLAGKRIRCKVCNGVVDVPAPMDELEDAGEYDVAGDAASQGGSQQDDTPPWVRDPSLIGGQNTVASNPGLLKFEPFTYLKCLPGDLWMMLIVGVIAIVATMMFKPEIIVFVLIGLVVAGVLQALNASRLLASKFHGGTRNPAVVVSEFPLRIAVFADLSTGVGSKPSILICGAPLRFATGGPFKVGTRLAAVAHYAGNANAPHWLHFMPTPVNCGVSDPRAIAGVMASFTRQDWAELDQGLARLPTRKPGMYYLWEPQVRQQKTSPIVYAFLIFVVVALVLAFGTNAARNKKRQAVDDTPAAAPTSPQPTPRPPSQTLPGGPRNTGPYAAGDKIDVRSKGRWLPATVVEVQGTQLQVDYDPDVEGADEMVPAMMVRRRR